MNGRRRMKSLDTHGIVSTINNIFSGILLEDSKSSRIHKIKEFFSSDICLLEAYSEKANRFFFELIKIHRPN